MQQPILHVGPPVLEQKPVEFYQLNPRGHIYALRGSEVLWVDRGPMLAGMDYIGREELRKLGKRVPYSSVPNNLRAALRMFGWRNTNRRHKGGVRR